MAVPESVNPSKQNIHQKNEKLYYLVVNTKGVSLTVVGIVTELHTVSTPVSVQNCDRASKTSNLSLWLRIPDTCIVIFLNNLRWL